ncbi:MAG: hypothetical protein ACRD9L_23655, partial [Bryobacteraceae bacterium]
GELVVATVLDVVTDDGWLEVRDEPWSHAIEGDTPWIAPCLVVRNFSHEAERAVRNLTLEELRAEVVRERELRLYTERRIVEWQNRCAELQNGDAGVLTLEEKLIASIAIANYRKERKVA